MIYNLTDTFFIGLLDDPVQLGAISLAFPVFILMLSQGVAGAAVRALIVNLGRQCIFNIPLIVILNAV